LGLTHDALPQRQEDVAIVQRAVLGILHPLTQCAGGRANAHAQGVVFLLCPAEFRQGTPQTRLPLIEQGNGELDERTNFPSAVSALSCCAEGYLWNESGGARDAELFARDYHTLPGAGQVEALAQCLRFQFVDRQWVARG
jgi:hypothetical protein